MPSRGWTSGLLLTILAVVFSIGLTFASVELPSLLHGALAGALPSNEGDSHADDAALLRTELFMQHSSDVYSGHWTGRCSTVLDSRQPKGLR